MTVPFTVRHRRSMSSRVRGRTVYSIIVPGNTVYFQVYFSNLKLNYLSKLKYIKLFTPIDGFIISLQIIVLIGFK